MRQRVRPEDQEPAVHLSVLTRLEIKAVQVVVKGEVDHLGDAAAIPSGFDVRAKDVISAKLAYGINPCGEVVDLVQDIGMPACHTALPSLLSRPFNIRTEVSYRHIPPVYYLRAVKKRFHLLPRRGERYGEAADAFVGDVFDIYRQGMGRGRLNVRIIRNCRKLFRFHLVDDT